MAFKKLADRSKGASMLNQDGSITSLWRMIFFLVSFGWPQPISTATNRGRLKEIRRLRPGVRPGKPTADFLRFHDDAAQFAGAIF